MTRKLWLLGICSVAASLGCGDDDAMTEPDAGTNVCTMIDMAPMPEELSGACCSRQTNADRQDAPEFRLAGIVITSPPPLANPLISQLLRDNLDSERFNWVFQATITGSDVSVLTGYGERDPAGTFSFVMGTAPGPGDANRWNPVTATGTISGEVVMTDPIDGVMTVPILNEDGTVTTELPLRNLTLNMATLSDSRSCIGTRGPGRYRTDEGQLEAYITVDESKEVLIDTSALMTSLCNLLANMAGETDNCVTAQDTWPNPPDSMCDTAAGTCSFGGCTAATCNAWRVQAGFAAHGVEITP